MFLTAQQLLKLTVETYLGMYLLSISTPIEILSYSALV